MSYDTPGMPPELNILERELDGVADGWSLIDEHLSIFLDTIAKLRGHPADQWIRWGWSAQSPPSQLRRLGRKTQTIAGKFLALGGAVTRFAETWERELTTADSDSYPEN